MNLTFHGNAAKAARHVIVNTPLGRAPYEAMRGNAHHGTLEVCVDDAWRWSSGERVLIDVLKSLAGDPGFFAPADLHAIDRNCQEAVITALAILAGLPVESDGKHKAA